MGQNSLPFYISAGLSAMSNYLIYTLSGTDAANYNPNIPNRPYVVKTQTQNNFEILTYSTQSVNENTATFSMTISNLGQIYYLAYVSPHTILQAQVI